MAGLLAIAGGSAFFFAKSQSAMNQPTLNKDHTSINPNIAIQEGINITAFTRSHVAVGNAAGPIHLTNDVTDPSHPDVGGQYGAVLDGLVQQYNEEGLTNQYLHSEYFNQPLVQHLPTPGRTSVVLSHELESNQAWVANKMDLEHGQYKFGIHGTV